MNGIPNGTFVTIKSARCKIPNAQWSSLQQHLTCISNQRGLHFSGKYYFKAQGERFHQFSCLCLKTESYVGFFPSPIFFLLMSLMWLDQAMGQSLARGIKKPIEPKLDFSVKFALHYSQHRQSQALTALCFCCHTPSKMAEQMFFQSYI